MFSSIEVVLRYMSYAIFRRGINNKLALVTGLRAGEIQALRQRDILENALNVEHSWNFKDGLKVTKNKVARRVYIPFPEIMIELKKLADSNPFTKDGTGYIFYASIPNKPQDSRRWLDALKKELERREESKAIIEKVTFHGWRHFFTTYMRQSGMDDRLIQRITGHKSASMLHHYSNHSLLKDSEKILSTTKTIFEPLLI